MLVYSDFMPSASTLMGDRGSKKPEGLDDRGFPVRVMVVDDEGLVRRIISQVLRSVGYEVAGEAQNGQHAVQMQSVLKPAIITMDVKMPVMDGLEALKEIRKKDKDVKVLMLTSENDKPTVTAILQAGATDYMLKPLDRDRILEKLRSIRGIQE
jgi:two-component system chemotaxis response regulator CheY